MKIEDLLKYYIECIEIESLEDFSFPSFKENQVFIRLPLSSEWSGKDNPILTLALPQELRRTLALGGQSTSIFYGYPIHARPAVTKNGDHYVRIEPVFLLRVEFEQDGTSYNLTLLKEHPKINDSILKQFAPTIEERIQLLDNLGIVEAELLTEGGLKECWDKLMKLYPDIHLNEPIQNDNLSDRHFSHLNKEGFYNQAILMIASPPRYSRGLLRELRLLNIPDNHKKISSTSLQTLLEGCKSSDASAFELSQISKLNRSQRQAASKAFTNPISVITGPPGTGKSQVVLNILANAFERNQSVLFTSKNNKAVDVVCKRLLELVDFPINLRLGSRTAERDYTTEFLDLLDKVLSGGDKDAIETTYIRTKKYFEDTRKKYFELLGRLENIVDDRNRIDELDKQCEYYENIIEENLLLKIRKLYYRESNAIELAQIELRLLESNQIPFIYKIIGFFSKTYPYKKLHSYCKEANNLIGGLLNLPEKVDSSIAIYSDFLSKVCPVSEYIKLHSEIVTLRKKVADEDINALSEDVEKLEVEFVQSYQKYLEALGRYRMIHLSTEQRKDLTNYYAVVRQLSGEYGGNKAYAQLKEQQEKLFRKISKILPVWSVTNLSAGGHFPFAPDIFDIVVIDEASQSDIASALPLLFRARSTVIIGDPRQLKHISTIGIPQNNRLMSKYNLLDGNSSRFAYSTQSLYDCSRGVVNENGVILLNEHYRSHFSIIEFSNREWYDHNLEIRTNYDNLFFPPDGREYLEWVNVMGQTVRPGTSALNKLEADRLLEVLEEVLSIYVDSRISIGIVTPFAAQKDYITRRLSERYDENFIRSHLLLANTAHQFQGDERDIVLFSPVISNGAGDKTIGFLRSTSNLFNVSITRARSILWVVGDRNACVNAGIPYLSKFVEYISYKRYMDIDLPYASFQSPWEKKFFEVLRAEGFEPISQHPAGPYFIDIALINDTSKLAIEVDGKHWHTNLTGERLERDIVRDRNLRRMGWDVIRFWVHDLKYDLVNCLKIVEERFKQ